MLRTELGHAVFTAAREVVAAVYPYIYAYCKLEGPRLYFLIRGKRGRLRTDGRGPPKPSLSCKVQTTLSSTPTRDDASPATEQRTRGQETPVFSSESTQIVTSYVYVETKRSDPVSV